MSPIYRCSCGQPIHIVIGATAKGARCPHCGNAFTPPRATRSEKRRPRPEPEPEPTGCWPPWITLGLLAGVGAVLIDHAMGRNVLITEIGHVFPTSVAYGLIGFCVGLGCRLLHRKLRIPSPAILAGMVTGLLAGAWVIYVDRSIEMRTAVVGLFAVVGLLLAGVGGGLLKRATVWRALVSLGFASVFGIIVAALWTQDWEQVAECVAIPPEPQPPEALDLPPPPELPPMPPIPRPEIAAEVPAILEGLPATHGIDGQNRVYLVTVPKEEPLELSVTFSGPEAFAGAWGWESAEVLLEGPVTDKHEAGVVNGKQGVHWGERLVVDLEKHDSTEWAISPQIRCSLPLSESSHLHQRIALTAKIDIVYARYRGSNLLRLADEFENVPTTLSQAHTLVVVTPEELKAAQEYASEKARLTRQYEQEIAPIKRQYAERIAPLKEAHARKRRAYEGKVQARKSAMQMQAFLGALANRRSREFLYSLAFAILGSVYFCGTGLLILRERFRG